MHRFSAKPYLQRVWADFGNEVGFDDFPFNIPAVRELQSIEFHADVTFFVGENGSGKSTMLEAIALALGFGIEGGTLNNRLLNTSGEHTRLADHIRMSRSTRRPSDGYFLRAESFYNLATYLDRMPETSVFGGYGALAHPPAGSVAGDASTGAGSVAVHHRDALADSACVPWREDPSIRRQRHCRDRV
jgi:predicted ATPase